MSDKVHGLKDRKKSEETRRKTRKTNKNKAYSDLSKKELTPWMKRKRKTLNKSVETEIFYKRYKT